MGSTHLDFSFPENPCRWWKPLLLQEGNWSWWELKLGNGNEFSSFSIILLFLPEIKWNLGFRFVSSPLNDSFPFSCNWFLSLELTHDPCFWKTHLDLPNRKNEKSYIAPNIVLGAAQSMGVALFPWGNGHTLIQGFLHPCNVRKSFFLMFVYLFIYLFIFYLWERESMRGRAAEREGDTDSEAGSRLWTVTAQSPMQGLNSQAGRSWPSWSQMLNWLSHLGAPVRKS